MAAEQAKPGPLGFGAGDEKPLPSDFSHLYSQTSKNRAPSKMKEYYKFFQIPGIGNLAGGLPNVRFFPFDTLEAQTAKPERWTPTPNKSGGSESQVDGDDGDGGVLVDRSVSVSEADRMAPAHITVPKTTDETDLLKKIDLATALQYGTADGYPPLLSWIRQFSRENLHPDVPYAAGPDCVLTVGSTDGMGKTLDLFVDPWSAERGDDVRDRPGMLCERFVYGNVLTQAMPKGVQIVPIQADAGGMCASGPGGLEDVLGNWDESRGRRPHLMYTVTMGHNPTGVLLSPERRKEIYAACSKYDVIIIEDDPYWYLQFPSADAEEATSRGLPPPYSADLRKSEQRSTGYPFLDSLTPSFLSFDIDGRVVRLDTFSKTVAPGCRLGWVTAQPAIIERIVRITESTTQQPSGFVQSVIGELVMGEQPAAAVSAFRSFRSSRERAAFSGWKTDGWVRWLAGLRGEYERRMVRMCRILDDGAVELKQGTPLRASDADWGVVTKTKLYEFRWPRGGMFIWIKMLYESHPLWGAPRSDGSGVVDGMLLCPALMMFLTRKPHLVLVSPGLMFSADAKIRAEDGWAFFRLCFAAEAEEEIDSCSRRFVRGVHRFWKIKSVGELEDLLKDAPMAAAGSAMDGLEAGEDDLGFYLGC